jgi:hypothetical protein
MTETENRQSGFWYWTYLAAAIFAGGFVWAAGHRGVFILDQSIMFDGGWRVYQGQIPYRDFVTAFPPLPFFIQSLLFHLRGVSFSAMVLGAAVMNVIGTICIIWLTRRLLPELPPIALIAGLLTAVWFAAPFGTLWFEQTGFFFNLLALVALVRSRDSARYARIVLRIAAGVLLASSMLSKQNAGLEFIPIALGVAAIPQMPQLRRAAAAVFQTCAGLVLGFAIFGVWLWIFSSPAEFWHCYVVLTRQIGTDRIGFLTTVIGMLTVGVTWHYSIVALAALALGVSKARTAPDKAPNLALIVWIVAGSVFYQNLFKLHTDNEIENSLPYLGLVYGLSFGLFWKYGVSEEIRTASRAKKALLIGAGCIVLGLPFYAGLRDSWSRRVQEFPSGATFTNSIQVPGMSGVKWGEPTYFGLESTISHQDFEALNTWLSAQNVNFFVFPDSTILYGLHGRVSPQPWLYFSPGHSFLKEELPKVDAAVVESLHRNNVRVVILEKDSWVKNQNLWKEMPRLKAWIEQDFEKAQEFGVYDVRVLKGEY